MAQGVPGLRGMQHVGVTVPDLDAAVVFFEELFAAHTLVRGGPVPAEGDWMARHLAADADSRLERLAILRIGHGTNLELLEYSHPRGLGEAPTASAHSATHVAFEVDDLDAAAAHLRARGVAVLAGPNRVTEGDLAGLRWIYLRTPWGQIVELLAAPGGLGYASAGGDCLWDPKQPAA